VRAIAEDVAERGPVAQNGAKIERMPVRVLQLERREHQASGDHQQRTKAGDEERGAPSDVVGDKLRDQERQPNADREAGGVKCHAARCVARRKPVCQRFQAGM